MLKTKLLPLVGALAMGAFIAAGAGSARADEIYFGNITPSSGITGGPPACSHVAGDEGYVCNNGQTFSAEGSTFTATGYSDTFVNASALTWKSVTTPLNNGFGESGLGENAIGPQSTAQACTDNSGVPGSTPCEIGIGAAVAVQSTLALTDVLIGSVQAPERFQLYAADSLADLLASPSTHTFLPIQTDACLTSSPGPDTGDCLYNLPVNTFVVGVVDLASNPAGSASDVLITAVSVPAPIIGHGLPVLLAVGGLLFGARLWDRSKRRLSLGTAMPHAAA